MRNAVSCSCNARKPGQVAGGLLAFVLAATSGVASANDIVDAARRQVGVTIHYDPAYQKLAFPNGDIPRDRGVCTDVIVRALRDAKHIDLQREVNADLSANRDAYPHRWTWLKWKADPSIDHRRVPNLMTYFARRGYAVGVSADPADYHAGDIVAWNLNGSILHIGIVSDQLSGGGYPLIIHNIGRGAQEEDLLFRFRIIGHYRLPES